MRAADRDDREGRARPAAMPATLDLGEGEVWDLVVHDPGRLAVYRLRGGLSVLIYRLD
jgi:hypothetical protein